MFIGNLCGVKKKNHMWRHPKLYWRVYKEMFRF